MNVSMYRACLGTHKQKQLSPGRFIFDRLDLSLPPWIIEESKKDVNADSLCWTQPLWHTISSIESQTSAVCLYLAMVPVMGCKIIQKELISAPFIRHGDAYTSSYSHRHRVPSVGYRWSGALAAVPAPVPHDPPTPHMKARSEHAALKTPVSILVLSWCLRSDTTCCSIQPNSSSAAVTQLTVSMLQSGSHVTFSNMLLQVACKAAYPTTSDAAFEITFSRVSCMASKALCEGTAARALMISSTNGLPEPNMRTSKSSRPAHSNDSGQADHTSYVRTHALSGNSVLLLRSAIRFIVSLFVKLVLENSFFCPCMPDAGKCSLNASCMSRSPMH